MRRYSAISRLLAAGMMAGVLAAPALAQGQGARGQGWGMGQMMPGGGWGNGPMMSFGPDTMLDRIDGRLAFLKTELKITEAQTAAWDAFAETVHATSEAHNVLMQAMMEQMRDGDYFKMSLPDRLEFQQTQMEARLEQIKDMKGATDELYAVLDDDQKKAADETVLPMMGMGMGGGGRYGMGPGMMFR